MCKIVRSVFSFSVLDPLVVSLSSHKRGPSDRTCRVLKGGSVLLNMSAALLVLLPDWQLGCMWVEQAIQERQGVPLKGRLCSFL